MNFLSCRSTRNQSEINSETFFLQLEFLKNSGLQVNHLEPRADCRVRVVGPLKIAQEAPLIRFPMLVCLMT